MFLPQVSMETSFALIDLEFTIKIQNGVGNVDLGADDPHLLTPAEIGDAK